LRGMLLMPSADRSALRGDAARTALEAEDVGNHRRNSGFGVNSIPDHL
jgi:hypothetical protein